MSGGASLDCLVERKKKRKKKEDCEGRIVNIIERKKMKRKGKKGI